MQRLQQLLHFADLPDNIEYEHCLTRLQDGILKINTFKMNLGLALRAIGLTGARAYHPNLRAEAARPAPAAVQHLSAQDVLKHSRILAETRDYTSTHKWPQLLKAWQDPGLLRVLAQGGLQRLLSEQTDASPANVAAVMKQFQHNYEKIAQILNTDVAWEQLSKEAQDEFKDWAQRLVDAMEQRRGATVPQ